MRTLGRRTFLQLLPASLLACPGICGVTWPVIGGGVGGCAAAIAACRNGMRVVMTEETDWVGGQLTSQAVPPDEHPWIESFGCTALYRSYRNTVREYYRRHLPITEELRQRVNFNPGGGSVSGSRMSPGFRWQCSRRCCHHGSAEGNWSCCSRTSRLALTRVVTRSGVLRFDIRSGSLKTLTARYFLDATEQGDLLPLTKTEYVTGFESQGETGEPHAPRNAQPDNIQSFTVCFAIDHIKDQSHVIDKPEEYSFWRDFVPKLQPAWTGNLLSWSMSDPKTLGRRPVSFNPVPPYKTPTGTLNLWMYRRIAAQEQFVPGAYRSDISLVNWPQNDYWLGNLHEVSEAEAARHLARAKQLSLSLLYWMQTEAPRPDGGQGFPGLRLRYDQTGTEDGLAKYPYIRESRRIRAEFTVLEQHVGTDARQKTSAESFSDSVGVGSYRIDLHPSSGGNNYIDISSLPFQIPLGALIPRRVENLIPACKNLGVTHITNGCYRLHPVEWNIGESAGCLAAQAVRTSARPRQIRSDARRLADLQKKIQDQGVEIAWPRLTPR